MNVELNITMRCNLRCTNCNRLCGRFPDRTEDLSLEQLERFINQSLAASPANRVRDVKVVGGEPLLHPQFSTVYSMLCRGIDIGAFSDVRISTNRTLPIPDLPAHASMGWMGTHPRRKRHVPYLWSPQDLGYNVSGPCQMPRRCGISLDARGYLPCSGAIMIARAFGLEHLYRHDLPTGPWGMEELCWHCIHAMPKDWQRQHSYRVSRTPREAKTPTPSWAKALERLTKETAQ